MNVHYIELKARFTELSSNDQKFYTDYLNTIQDDLGNFFATQGREEFEDAVTDIIDFEPLMNALVSLNLVEIDGG